METNESTARKIAALKFPDAYENNDPSEEGTHYA
jgi:hypothetical protein